MIHYIIHSFRSADKFLLSGRISWACTRMPGYPEGVLAESLALNGFDGIDDGAAEAVLFEGCDATDSCTAR